MRTWFVLVMMAAVALSGCASDDGTGFEPTSSTLDDDVTGNTTADPGAGSTDGAVENGTEAAENLVPVLFVETSALNGTAPLVVDFTVDAEDDSEGLTWAFLVDGNETLSGTELPATFNHTFEEGAYNVTITVTDGEHLVEEGFAVDAAAAAAEVLPDVVLEGSVLLPDAPWGAVIGGCLMDAGRRDLGGPDGITGTRHDLDPSSWGRSYSFDVAGVVAEFWPGLASGTSGTVPADVEYVVVCINDPTVVDVDYTLTITG